MKHELSVPERLMLVDILQATKGSILTLRVATTLVAAFGLSAEEVERFELKVEGPSVLWPAGAPAKDGWVREFDLRDAEVHVVQDRLRRMEAEGALALPHVQLYDKFFPGPTALEKEA